MFRNDPIPVPVSIQPWLSEFACEGEESDCGGWLGDAVGLAECQAQYVSFRVASEVEGGKGGQGEMGEEEGVEEREGRGETIKEPLLLPWMRNSPYNTFLLMTITNPIILFYIMLVE